MASPDTPTTDQQAPEPHDTSHDSGASPARHRQIVGPALISLLTFVAVIVCVASIAAFGLGAMRLIWTESGETAAYRLLLTGAVGFLGGLMTLVVVRLAR